MAERVRDVEGNGTRENVPKNLVFQVFSFSGTDILAHSTDFVICQYI